MPTPKNKRNTFDFTDKELYSISLAIKTHLNSRETWMSKGNAKVFNTVINKIINEGNKRNNPRDILHPLVNFD
jgi:hypothetical protein